jgi:iron(III) transport system substrate-binding protein
LAFDPARPALAPLLLALALAGCSRDDAPDGPSLPDEPAREVVVYTALDQEFSNPILLGFEKAEGVRVLPKYDVESTKSFGLAAMILAESASPQCDLYWNNEIINTLRLKQRDLLEPFHPAHGEDYPAAYRDPDGYWYGFAARARVLIVNTELVPEADRPDSIQDLLDPKWKGKIAIAKPLFGTTATHAACLFAAWGEEKARKFFEDLKANDVQVLSGNRQVAADVAAGRLAFGLTDTDDALGVIEAGSPVAIIYPDRGEDDLGTLFIPNTLAKVKGAPHPEMADKLAGYLLAPEVETALANGPSAQIPLNPKVEASARVETPRTVHAMTVDFEKAASLWELTVAPFLADTFATAE